MPEVQLAEAKYEVDAAWQVQSLTGQHSPWDIEHLSYLDSRMP